MRTNFNILIIILFFNCFSSIKAQTDIKFDKRTFDFGITLNDAHPPAVFEYTNTSTKPLAILLVNANNPVSINYKKVFIQPGKSGKLYVNHNNNKLGNFEETIEIITNLSNTPEYLTIKGTNVSVQECFPNKNDLEQRKIIVIDSESKQPIPEVNLSFLHNFNNHLEGKTNKKGILVKSLKIGTYSIEAKAEGYYTKNESLFINKSRPMIYIEMDPKKQEIIDDKVVTNENVVMQEDKIVSKEDTSIIESDILPESLFAANNIILIVDVSLSMKTYKKLELLKISLNNLMMSLRSIDKVSLIAYSTYAYPKLTAVSGNKKDTLINAIDKLKPSGITNGVKGLDKGYEYAFENFIPKGNNQIILATDGEFSGSEESEEIMKKMIQENSEKGIILSIIGFGINEDAIAGMNKMAEYGKGKYIHVKAKEDATNTLLNEIKENSRKK